MQCSRLWILPYLVNYEFLLLIDFDLQVAGGGHFDRFDNPVHIQPGHKRDCDKLLIISKMRKRGNWYLAAKLVEALFRKSLPRSCASQVLLPEVKNEGEVRGVTVSPQCPLSRNLRHYRYQM